MAFFGYDPFRGVSNVGQTIAGVGQQIGQTVSQIPQLQQQERLGAQQEESNRLGIESQRFQQKKVEAAEKQLAENPGVLKDYGDGLANDLDVAISNLPKDLRDSVGHIPDAFRKNYSAYGKIKRLSQSEMSGVSDKLRTDFKKQSELILMAKAVGSGSNITTKNKFRAYVAKNFPTITEQQLMATPGFQGLADDPKVLSAMDKAKLTTEGLKADELRTKIKGLKEASKSDLPERKFDELRLSRLRRAEEDIDTKINLVEKDKVKNDAVISAFDSGTKLRDPRGYDVDVTKEMYKQATSDNQRLDTRIENLVKAKEARQKEFMKSGKAGDTFGRVGDVKSITSLGDYPTNWTVESNPATKSRKRTIDKIIKKYDKFVKSSSNKYGVPEDLFYAIMAQESLGRAKSPDSQKGAAGLMQIMPENFKAYGIPKNKWRDPATNIDVAGRLMKDWLRRYGEDGLETVIAAYNSKTANIPNGRWKKIKETRDYVPKIRGNLEYLKSLRETEEKAYLEAVSEMGKPYADYDPNGGTEAVTNIEEGHVPSGETSPVVKPTPTTKSAPPARTKSYHEYQIRRTWGSANIEEKRAILARLKKREKIFPELMKKLNAEFVREVNSVHNR